MRVLAMASLLFLTGCGCPITVCAPIAASALSYLASINNFGAETLRFVDKPQSCRVPEKE